MTEVSEPSAGLLMLQHTYDVIGLHRRMAKNRQSLGFLFYYLKQFIHDP